jgi:hypothetical protein
MKNIDALLASSKAESRAGDAGLAALLLGLRALALVLKHEWCGKDMPEGYAICPECKGQETMFVPCHAPDCEWGAVVKEAREIV